MSILKFKTSNVKVTALRARANKSAEAPRRKRKRRNERFFFLLFFLFLILFYFFENAGLFADAVLQWERFSDPAREKERETAVLPARGDTPTDKRSLFFARTRPDEEKTTAAADEL